MVYQDNIAFFLPVCLTSFSLVVRTPENGKLGFAENVEHTSMKCLCNLPTHPPSTPSFAVIIVLCPRKPQSKHRYVLISHTYSTPEPSSFFYCGKEKGYGAESRRGGLMVLDRAVRVRELAGVIVLCSWARHLTSIPSRGSSNTPSRFHATETRISSAVWASLARVRLYLWGRKCLAYMSHYSPKWSHILEEGESWKQHNGKKLARLRMFDNKTTTVQISTNPDFMSQFQSN